MRILSFDIEEWYIEKKFNGGHRERYQEFDFHLKSILDILDETSTKATFFCLGKIATDFPEVIKAISAKGHEVGCHSNEHLWLTKMTPDQLQADTRNAIVALEDVCGEKIVSYRAPAFSIGNNNKWAVEILANEGIQRDASIFPAVRDFGGFASFPTDSPSYVSYNGITVKEFPICLTTFYGKEVAYSGGGYFRFFPYSYIQNRMNSSDYAMSYFHIDDLLHNRGEIMSRKEYEDYFREPGTLKNRVIRYIKSNLGTRGAFNKMNRLIRNNNFISLKEADSMINWSEKEIIRL